MAASPHQPIRAKIDDLAAARLDPRALRLAAIDLLAGTLDFEHYVFVLTDPVTAVGVDPLAVVPPGTRLPQLIRAKYLTRTNRWTDLKPKTLAIMHGSSFTGDCARALDDLNVALREVFGPQK